MSNRFKLNGIIYQEVIQVPKYGNLVVLNDNHQNVFEFDENYEADKCTVVIAVGQDDDN